MSVTHNKTRLASDFLLLTIGLVSVGTVLFFTFASGVSFSPDRQIDALAKDVIQRVPIALFLLVLCRTTDLKSGLRFTVTLACLSRWQTFRFPRCSAEGQLCKKINTYGFFAYNVCLSA